MILIKFDAIVNNIIGLITSKAIMPIIIPAKIIVKIARIVGDNSG